MIDELKERLASVRALYDELLAEADGEDQDDDEERSMLEKVAGLIASLEARIADAQGSDGSGDQPGSGGGQMPGAPEATPVMFANSQMMGPGPGFPDVSLGPTPPIPGATMPVQPQAQPPADPTPLGPFGGMAGMVPVPPHAPTPSPYPTIPGVPMGPPVISGSVGSGGNNDPEDVGRIQDLLNEQGATPPLVCDGDCGKKTIQAIRDFQERVFGWKDGKIDPGGKTWSGLTGEVAEIVEDVVETASSAASEVVETVVDTVEDAVEEVADFLGDIFGGDDEDDAKTS